MRVCIYGCGAIGSLLAYRLAAAGARVMAVARGAQLAALQSDGLRLRDSSGCDLPALPVDAAASAGELAGVGTPDVVFLTVKAHALPAVAEEITALLGDRTRVVTAANGLPWWYFYGANSLPESTHLNAVDPGGRLWHAIGPARAIGCVVYPAAELVEPGLVAHLHGDRLALGEPATGSGSRLTELSRWLGRAGFAAPAVADIRPELWAKLMANAAYNPVSVITGKTLAGMIDDPGTRRLLLQIMAEVSALASRLGVTVDVEPGELLELTRPLGEHRTSMLQDFAARRPLEVGPVIDALLELAELCETDMPALSTVRQLLAARVEQGY